MTDPRKALEDRLASATEMLEGLAHIGRSIVSLVPIIQNDISIIRAGLALFPPAIDSAYNEPAPVFPPQAHDGREIVTEAAPAATGVEGGADAVGAGVVAVEKSVQSAQAVTESGPDQSGPLLDVEDLPESFMLSQSQVDWVLDDYADLGRDPDEITMDCVLGSKIIYKILLAARAKGDPRIARGDIKRRERRVTA